MLSGTIEPSKRRSVRPAGHYSAKISLLVIIAVLVAFRGAAAAHPGSGLTASLELLPNGAVHKPLEQWPPRPPHASAAIHADGEHTEMMERSIEDSDLTVTRADELAEIYRRKRGRSSYARSLVESLVSVGANTILETKDEADEMIVPTAVSNKNITKYYQAVVEPVGPLMVLFPKVDHPQPCVSPLWAPDDPVCNNARAVYASAVVNGSDNGSLTRFWVVPAGEPCQLRCSKGNWHLKPNVDMLPCNNVLLEDVPDTLQCSCCLSWVTSTIILLPLVFLGAPLSLVCYVRMRRGSVMAAREESQHMIQREAREWELDQEQEKMKAAAEAEKAEAAALEAAK
jgi:hypothetical protein